METSGLTIGSGRIQDESPRVRFKLKACCDKNVQIATARFCGEISDNTEM